MLSPRPIPIKTLTHIQSAPVLLESASIVEVGGPDSLKFLQSQFMNDVSALCDGGWQWSGWLNPKGRLQALFILYRLSAEHYLIVLIDHDPEQFCAGLKRFVFRSKVSINHDTHLAWATFDVEEANAPEAHVAAIDLSNSKQARMIYVQRGPKMSGTTQDAAMIARWYESDMRAGIPRLSTQQQESWTPQMLSLERLNAYSVKKGCYPGQEVISRTHFLGQSKRQLILIECAAGGLHASQKINVPADDSDLSEVGTIICVGQKGDLALAVSSDSGAEEFIADHLICEKVPFDS